MATPEEEERRSEALDNARNDGANAWSPSRAREAVRRAGYQMNWGHTLGEPHRTIAEMDRRGSFDSPEEYRAAFYGIRGYPAPAL